MAENTKFRLKGQARSVVAWVTFYANGDKDIQEISLGADGTVLTSNGEDAAPSYQAPASPTPDPGKAWLSAAGGSLPSSGGAELTSVELATNGIVVPCLAFDKDTDEEVQFTIPMPDDWDGNDLTAKFHWIANDTSTNTVYWTIAMRSLADGEAFDQALGTAVTVSDANASTANQLRISAESGDITPAGTPAAGEVLQIKITRDADNGSDNLDADALLIGVMLEYVRE